MGKAKREEKSLLLDRVIETEDSIANAGIWVAVLLLIALIFSGLSFGKAISLDVKLDDIKLAAEQQADVFAGMIDDVKIVVNDLASDVRFINNKRKQQAQKIAELEARIKYLECKIEKER